jgi:hypothetical protein
MRRCPPDPLPPDVMTGASSPAGEDTEGDGATPAVACPVTSSSCHGAAARGRSFIRQLGNPRILREFYA